MIQRGLFGVVRRDGYRYPAQPGHRERTGDTSRAAAERIAGRAEQIRGQCLAAIEAAGDDGLTADECAAEIGATPFAVRPRVTELGKKEHGEKIVKSGRKRPNVSGSPAHVWAVRA